MPPTTTSASENRDTVKAKIQEMNQLAKDADAKMREALQARNQASADLWRERRDYYNAEVRRLTDWLNAPPAAAPDTASANQFIIAVADSFNATGNQDSAHNAILKELLDGKYSAARIPANDSKAAAYKIIRENNSSPLYWIRNQTQAQDMYNRLPLISDAEQRRFPRLNLSGRRMGQTFFIRDFMQIYSQGNLTIGNLVVVDDSVYASFAQDFDKLVNNINAYQQQRGRTHRVFPFLRMAHRDAFQLIPDRTADGIDRFGGAVMSNVSISGNVIYSDGALQGIFASDGAFRNLHIRNNHLQIGGQHTISISGMLSGSIMGNTDIQNQPLAADKITLYPLRLGGGANIYIIGFKNKSSLSPTDGRYYQYDAILGVPPARDFRQQVQTRGRCYRAVDMLELHTLLKRQNPQTPAQWQVLMDTLVQRGFAQAV